MQLTDMQIPNVSMSFTHIRVYTNFSFLDSA